MNSLSHCHFSSFMRINKIYIKHIIIMYEYYSPAYCLRFSFFLISSHLISSINDVIFEFIDSRHDLDKPTIEFHCDTAISFHSLVLYIFFGHKHFFSLFFPSLQRIRSSNEQQKTTTTSRTTEIANNCKSRVMWWIMKFP